MTVKDKYVVHKVFIALSIAITQCLSNHSTDVGSYSSLFTLLILKSTIAAAFLVGRNSAASTFNLLSSVSTTLFVWLSIFRVMLELNSSGY